MKIRLMRDVYIRCSGDEVAIVDFRTGGCSIVKGAQPFIKELTLKWRDVQSIVDAVACNVGCSPKDVECDVYDFLNELTSQMFIECDDDEFRLRAIKHNREALRQEHADMKSTEKGSPLGDYCERQGIAADFHLDLTDACTEHCVHCYVPKGQKDFLPIWLAEKALTEFRSMNGFTVHVTGGEAMMHPDFERICRKCVELNLNFIIFSNMTLCDEKRIAFLKEVQPQFINVSLYSMDPSVHDAITQLPGSWQRTHDAIVKCCEAGVACRIATPLLKENQDALPALRKFADEHHLHLVPAADIIAQADHGCGNLTHACSMEELRRVLTRDHGLFHKIYDGAMPACDAKVCDIGAGRLYLNAKGNYYPCDSMHEYVLGNARENTVEEIWKGEKLN